MGNRLTTRESGFSLLEMMIALALGGIVLSAAVLMYTRGVSASFMVSQKAELQQDFRAASNMLTTDLEEAGAGLGQGAAIALASTTTPKYGCDQTGTCYLNGVAGTYPVSGGTAYLYGLIPGYDLGPTIPSSNGPTDVVTVAYTDANFYLNCYNTKVTALGVVTFSEPSGATPWAGCLPSSVTTPQAVNDSAAGLTTGDLVMMTLGGTTVVAEVTGAITTSIDGNGNTQYAVPFANSDKLNMNQTPAGGGLNGAALNATGVASAAPCGQAGPCRLLVVSYYVDNTPTPPRLMRQVSGHSPMPVVENVAYLKFTYDLFNDSTNAVAVGCSNPGVASDPTCGSAASGLFPNQITKINILNLAVNSTQQGSQYGLGNGYQRLDLQTSVCARNLTYVNDYPN